MYNYSIKMHELKFSKIQTPLGEMTAIAHEDALVFLEFQDNENFEKDLAQIKDFFETNLANELNLTRVSAPLFVKKNTGINDNLSGTESPVSFSLSEIEKKKG